MDIVKQRRKRLMAWILAVVLCVGLWQGSVYAEGDEPAVEPEVVETLGDIETTMDPEVEQENSVMPVADGYNINVKLTDGNGNYIMTDSTNFNTENGFLNWSTGNSGNSYTAQFNDDSLKLTNIYFGYGGYKHNVLEWSYIPKEGSGKTTITTGTISLETIKPENVTMDGTTKSEYTLEGILGKSVKISFWEEGTSGDVLSESLNDNGQWTITLPTPDSSMMNSKDGLFFVGWQQYGEGEVLKAGSNYSEQYSEYETERYLGLMPNYSQTVYEDGKYSLLSSCQYYLRTGKWNVVEDEYTYIGNDTDMGTEFYINGDGKMELEFKLQ